MAVVRISLGRFDAAHYPEIRGLLDQSQVALVPAIKGLRGNLGYYVGINQANRAMTNVSIWETLDDAEQMASLKAMQDLAGVFVGAGVQFERPITNHDVLWTV
jgi:hypothetical protein